MNKIVSSGVLAVLLLLSVVGLMTVPVMATPDIGYNWKARIFVGTGEQWCMEKLGWDHPTCEAYMEPYAHDKLIMKWSEAWQLAEFGPDGIRKNGDELPWTSNAWENNEWNGAAPGGSGEVWHYKIKWIGECGADYTPLPDGGYCIWGQFEVLQDHGMTLHVGHLFLALAKPNGYGT